MQKKCNEKRPRSPPLCCMFCSHTLSIGNVHFCILFCPTHSLDRSRYWTHYLHVGSLSHLCRSLFLFGRLVCVTLRWYKSPDAIIHHSYGPFASSALAGQSLARESIVIMSYFLYQLPTKLGNLSATAFPLFINQMHHKLGFRIANIIFASIAALMMPIPFVRSFRCFLSINFIYSRPGIVLLRAIHPSAQQVFSEGDGSRTTKGVNIMQRHRFEEGHLCTAHKIYCTRVYD
jgi:hypothetical protein